MTSEEIKLRADTAQRAAKASGMSVAGDALWEIAYQLAKQTESHTETQELLRKSIQSQAEWREESADPQVQQALVWSVDKLSERVQLLEAGKGFCSCPRCAPFKPLAHAEPGKTESVSEPGKCPACGSPMAVLDFPSGWAIACESVDCKWTVPVAKTPNEKLWDKIQGRDALRKTDRNQSTDRNAAKTSDRIALKRQEVDALIALRDISSRAIASTFRHFGQKDSPEIAMAQQIAYGFLDGKLASAKMDLADLEERLSVPDPSSAPNPPQQEVFARTMKPPEVSYPHVAQYGSRWGLWIKPGIPLLTFNTKEEAKQRIRDTAAKMDGPAALSESLTTKGQDGPTASGEESAE